MEGESEDEKKFRAIAAALGATPGTPRPPDGWWERHVQMIKDEHPHHNEKRIAELMETGITREEAIQKLIDRAVGYIWYKGYKPEKREMALLDAAIHQT